MNQYTDNSIYKHDGNGFFNHAQAYSPYLKQNLISRDIICDTYYKVF